MGIKTLLKSFLIGRDKHDTSLQKVFIIVLSPFILMSLLIGAIFSNGISFNQDLTVTLFNGDTLSEELNQYAEELLPIQKGLILIDEAINSKNNELVATASLNTYQVKGYFIGFMLSQQYQFDTDKAKVWVKSYIVETQENDVITQQPTSVNSIIYSQLEHNLEIKLSATTKQMMEKVYAGLCGNNNGTVTTLTKEEMDQLINQFPENISELRKNIVIQAADAVGKIPYYWGGSANNPGYDGNDFGSTISPDIDGRIRKGLDCSHFVDWVYWTVMNNNLGNTNTTGQIEQCQQISINELLPGDLAFLFNSEGESTHVGIYAGMNENGERIWIHENAYDENVGINTVSYWTGYYRLNIMEGK